MTEEFLRKLADLLDEYKASITYTHMDDGCHVSVNGQLVFVGWLDDSRDLRKAFP